MRTSNTPRLTKAAAVREEQIREEAKTHRIRNLRPRRSQESKVEIREDAFSIKKAENCVQAARRKI